MLLATCRVSRVTCQVCDVPAYTTCEYCDLEQKLCKPGCETDDNCAAGDVCVSHNCAAGAGSAAACNSSRVTCPGPGVNGIVNITISTESCSGCIGSGNPTGFVEGGVAVYLQVGQPATSSSSILHLSGRIRHRVYISGPGQSGDGGL